MNRRERSFQKHVQTTHPMRANLIPTQQLIQSHPDFLNSFLLNHDHSQPEYPHISIYHLSLIHQISITLSRPLYFYNYPCPTNLLFFHPIFFSPKYPKLSQFQFSISSIFFPTHSLLLSLSTTLHLSLSHHSLLFFSHLILHLILHQSFPPLFINHSLPNISNNLIQHP